MEELKAPSEVNEISRILNQEPRDGLRRAVWYQWLAKTRSGVEISVLYMEELGNKVEVRDPAKVLGIPLGANRIGFIEIKDLSTIFGNS